MGIGKWLARRGAVGGTARWAASGYRSFRQRHPNPADMSDVNIFRLLIVTRYENFLNGAAEQFLLNCADELKGLEGLVVAILTAEARFSENSLEVQSMFREIIVEELRKGGLPDAAIRGCPKQP
jgi:hypothetical protein